MKKLIIVLILMFTVTFSTAQTKKEIRKQQLIERLERKQMVKDSLTALKVAKKQRKADLVKLMDSVLMEKYGMTYSEYASYMYHRQRRKAIISRIYYNY